MAVAVAVLVLAGATVAVTATASTDRTLVVTDDDTGERLLSVSVDDGDEVTLSYMHSVEQTPVEDVYVVDGTQLRMVRMVFHSYGAGLPATAPVERTDEGFVYEYEESYEELGVVPGSIADHDLIVDGERYDLAALADGPVVLSITEPGLVDELLQSDDRSAVITG